VSVKIEEIKVDGVNFEYKAVLANDDIENGISKAISQKAITYKIPGFRPGHVPLSIAAKKLRPSVLPNVLEEMVEEACKTIVNEIKKTGVNNFTTDPVYEIKNEYKEGQDIELSVFVEAVPTFELKEFQCKIIKILPKIEDNELEEMMQSRMKTVPVLEEVDNEYCVQTEDLVSCEVNVYINSVYNKKNSFEQKIIAGSISDQENNIALVLIGKKVGQVFEFIPPDKNNTKYKITIKSVQKKVDLPIEEYAKKIGFNDFESFKKDTSYFLKQKIDEIIFTYHKQQILSYLAQQYVFAIPNSVIKQETKNVIINIRR
jgi:trigger factor